MLQKFGLAAILLATMAVTAPAQEPESAAAVPGKANATGTLTFSISLKASSALADGTTLSVSCSAYAFDSANSNSSYVNPTATISGGKVSLKVSIPYKWIVSDHKDTVYVSVYVGGAGSGVYDTSSLAQSIPLPKNGSNTTILFNGTI